MRASGLLGAGCSSAAATTSRSSSRFVRAPTTTKVTSRTRRCRCTVRVVARFGGVADRPADSGVDISKRSGWDSDRDSNLATLPRPDTGNDGGSTDRQKGSPPGGGNHRLLLLNNPHKEPVVVKSLTQVVPACDEQHARNCFNTSQTLGMAIVTSCLKEHAEHYMMQLHRYGVTTAIEPDTTTA